MFIDLELLFLLMFVQCRVLLKRLAFALFPADDNLFEVYKEVLTLAPRWSDICCALNLPISHEEAIRKETKGDDCKRCLRMVLTKWLQKSYNYERCGHPTWKMLVEAVDDPAGGNNTTLAETIAKKHTGNLCIPFISSRCCGHLNKYMCIKLKCQQVTVVK